MNSLLKYLTLTLILTLQLSAADSLKLIHPNGGEVFEFGVEINVEWERYAIEENISFDFSSNNGLTWKEIIDSSKKDSYSWKAPFVESDSCLIRVKQVITLNTDVDIIWSKSMGGSKFESPGAIIQTNDGGFINISNTESDDYDIPNNKGYKDIWLTKLNATGEIEWSKTYGGQNDDYAYSILQTSDSGFLFGGNTSSNDGDIDSNYYPGVHDYWVIKTDNDGVIEWSRTYGGSKVDEGLFLTAVTDGGFIMVGNSNSIDGDLSETNNKGDKYDIWVIKIDKDGTIEWSKTYGGSEYEYVSSSVSTIDGGVVITALTESHDGDLESFGNKGAYDAWVVKLDKNGDKEWSKAIGGVEADYAKSVVESSDGNFFVTGYSKSKDGDFSKLKDKGNEDLWLLKLDPNGNELWIKSFGGSKYDEPKSIIQTDDNELVIIGRSSSDDYDLEKPGNKGGGFDAWVLKLNLDGEVVWSNTFGGTRFEEANNVIQTSDGNYVFTGITRSEDMDLEGTIYRGSIDTWILRFTEPVDQPYIEYDTTDEFFSIIPYKDKVDSNKLDILYPNGGEILVTESTSEIKWKGIDESTGVRLLFSSDNGKNWNVLFDSADGLSELWEVPIVNSDSCLIKVEEQHSSVKVKDLGWVQSFGGSEDDRINNIIQSKDNGIFIVGYSTSTDGNLESAGNKGIQDIWVTKLNRFSQVEWSKTYGGSLGESGVNVFESKNGHIILFGTTSSNDGDFYEPNERVSHSDIFIMELTSLGEIIKFKTFGGTGSELNPKVVKTINGNFIIACRSSSDDGDLPLNGNKGMTDIWVFALDSNWNIEYTRTFGGYHHEYIFDIKELDNYECLIIGQTTSTDGDLSELNTKGSYDVWVLKISENGEPENSKIFGGRSKDAIESCIRTEDGGYLLTGWSSSKDGDLPLNGNRGGNDIWVLKLNNSLEIEWSETYGGSNLDQAFSSVELDDGNYMISCVTSSNDDDFEGIEIFGEIDIMLLNISKNGELLWHKNYGGSKGELALQIIQKSSGNLILAGYHNSTDRLFENLEIHDNSEYNSFIMNFNIKQSLSDTTDAVFSIVKPVEPDSTYNFDYYVHDNNQSNSANAVVILEEDTDITIEVFDVLGRRIVELYSGLAKEGRNEYSIEYNDFQSGRYFVKLTTPEATKTEIIEILW